MGGWGKTFESIITSFPGGVRTSARGDLIPSATSPAAENASWENIGDGTAIIARRKGCRMLNPTDAVAAPIIGQAFFERLSSGSFTNHHILFDEDGAIHDLNSDGTVDDHTGGFSASIAGKFVSTAEAKNHLYVVAGAQVTAGGVTGTMLRYDGTNWRVGGMAAPAAPTAADTGVGVMNGTYEWALTYYNSNTGYESSRSTTTTTTPSNEQTQVSWSAPADAQVTHVNVYVRKATISTGFYRAASVAVGSTTTTLNLSDNDYNALTVLAPDEDENDPPPSGVKYLAWHKSRLFAATDTEVYYSKVELPEAFDPEKYEPVNPSDGQKITGLLSVFGRLVVFKTDSLHAITGDGPSSWVVEEISRGVGCVAPCSIVEAEGVVYWWSQEGPVMWDGVSAPMRLGKALVEATVNPLALATSRLEQIAGVADLRQGRVMWAVPAQGQTENNLIVPFKYQLGQFEGLWTSIHPASFVRGKDEDGLDWVFVGNYSGRVFQWWDGLTDGVPAGATASGTFTPGSTSVSAISGTGFDTTTGYVGLYVSVVNASTWELIGRRRISANTATSLTLANSLSGLSAGTEYYFFIGGVNLVFDTKWQDDAAAFYKKRYEFLFLETLADAATPVYVQFHTDWGGSLESPQTWTLTLTVPGGLGSGLWDYMLWDEGLWATTAPETNRLRIAKTGKTWRMRLTHTNPTTELRLLKVGVRGEYLTDKR